MQMAPQEVRTFFVGAVTWGKHPISRAEPMARLFPDTLRNYRVQHRYLHLDTWCQGQRNTPTVRPPRRWRWILRHRA
jgi:hypothetical protein